MFLKIMGALLLIAGYAAIAPAAETVTFDGSGKDSKGDPLRLIGRMTKPEGDGPFSAVVLLHGCGGISKRRDPVWAKRLVGWGYAALQVDSFKPRGVTNVCADRSLGGSLVEARAQDAHDARAYLSGLPFLDKDRIAVMGWSHGGSSTLAAIGSTARKKMTKEGFFRAAVAFYPYCRDRLDRMETPLLILIGDEDDWTPADKCEKNMPGRGEPKNEVILKVYPDSYHGFDTEGADAQVMGVGKSHRVRFNAAATEDAVVQARQFLGKHLSK